MAANRVGGFALAQSLRRSFYEFSGKLAPAEFGTSGHRGTSLKIANRVDAGKLGIPVGSAFGSFNEKHILAVAQAICDYRKEKGINGPHYVGIDSHALSLPAFMTAMRVFAQNRVPVFFERRLLAAQFKDGAGYTPTPSVSFAILEANRKKSMADGSVITPSHNPPVDGGYKYNPPSGGPAEPATTDWIQSRANQYIEKGMPPYPSFEDAIKSPSFTDHDFVTPYVLALSEAVDIDAIRSSGITMGVAPLGGASLEYYLAMQDLLGLEKLTVTDQTFDLSFDFMPVDHDGVIRMDCSSRNAMANLIALKDGFDIAWGNDTDSDRHGIVTPSSGLMNPNFFLSVVVWYLINNRPHWSTDREWGKTAVTTRMIDRIAAAEQRKVREVPVGFKWFVNGLLNAQLGLGCEESAGAAFPRMNGKAFTTDKDGLELGLLSAEMRARTGKDPAQLFEEVAADLHARPYYGRTDTDLRDIEEAKKLKTADPAKVTAKTLGGDPIIRCTSTTGSGDKFGGLLVETQNAWFATRPSGTEPKAKLYTESFVSEEHRLQVQKEAAAIIAEIIK